MFQARDELVQIEAAAKQIQSVCGKLPATVVVLGSGFGTVAERMEVDSSIAFSAIPAFPPSTVVGHSGKILVGRFSGHPVVLCVGRVHFYEGWTATEIVRPVRAMALAGGQTFLLTNASGGMQEAHEPGDFMVIRDHINNMGVSPLRGPNLDSLGARYPDMTQIYDPKLRGILKSAVADSGARVHEGTYLAVTGPQYETPAEIAFFKKIGADCVGMSTVPEAIALRHMGKRVAGLSLITNLAAGFEQELSHVEVLAKGRESAAVFATILEKFLIASRGTHGSGT